MTFQEPVGDVSAEQEQEALDRAGAELDTVEGVLGRLDAGTFAGCEVCGESIDRERLLGHPLSVRCAAHS